MSWQAALPELNAPNLFIADAPDTDDPFVQRFHEIDSDVTVIRRGANIPVLRGRYEDWRSFIEDAVRDNARPSRELIAANEMLAAWEAHLGIARVSSFPITVGFSLTDVCNARCVFCAYVPERVIEEKVSLERLERADWLRFCKNFTPNGGGLGEPFAHPQIIEILRLFKRNAPFLNFGSITNGSLLKDRVIDEITGYITYLYVSLNSARRETYETTMRPLKWDKLIGNLTRLKEEKERRGTPLPRLRCGFVVHAHNLDELPELPALLQSLGFTDLNVNFMTPPPHSESRKLYTAADTVYHVPDKANAAFRALEEGCVRHGILLVKPLPTLSLLMHGTQVPVPDAELLPKTVNKTTGFYGINTQAAPGATAEPPQPITVNPQPTIRKSASYGFEVYNKMHADAAAASREAHGALSDDEGITPAASAEPAAVVPDQLARPVEPEQHAASRPAWSVFGAVARAASFFKAVQPAPEPAAPDVPVAPAIEPVGPLAMPSERPRTRKPGAEARARPRPIIIDDTMPQELADMVEQHESGVSYEWVRFAARGQKAFCWSPWRMLKIDIFERTLICCNFFGKLPEFEWPTAATFHLEDGMWNHAFMQYLRRSMGKDDELPYCTFCKTSDKRHLGNSDAKTKARLESIEIYQNVLDSTRKVKFTGGIDALNSDINDLTVTVGRVKSRDQKVFAQEKNFYRKLVRQRGFVGRGRVLQLGAGTGAVMPFLAEAGNQVTLVDRSDAGFARLQAICSKLQLEVTMRQIDSDVALPFADASFDGVWIDGRWFQAEGRDRLFTELKRVLQPGGRLHVSQYPAIGSVVLDMIDAKAPAEGDAKIDLIDKGAEYDGVGNYVTMAKLPEILKRYGFVTEKTLPPQPIRIGGGAMKHAAIGRAPALIASRLRNEKYRATLTADALPLHGLERFVSFTAVHL